MKVVFIQGPTAAGKSSLALKLAYEFHGAIINCDSVQVYRSLDIGSAKPTAEEMVLVPHYLYSYVPEGAKMTAGHFARDFHQCMNEIKDKFPVVFVVGGTGFYFLAVEKGMYSVKGQRPELRERIEVALKENPLAVYHELKAKDPEYAAKISPNDHYRITRAMEIIWGDGKTVTEAQKEFEKGGKDFPFPLMKLGVQLDREEYLPAVQRRTIEMLNRGLIDEVQALIQRGLGNWEALMTVGYHEALKFIRGEMSGADELLLAIVQSTMKLIKKQRTWFQRDKNIYWVRSDQYELARVKVSEFLKGLPE